MIVSVTLESQFDLLRQYSLDRLTKAETDADKESAAKVIKQLTRLSEIKDSAEVQALIAEEEQLRAIYLQKADQAAAGIITYEESDEAYNNLVIARTIREASTIGAPELFYKAAVDDATQDYIFWKSRYDARYNDVYRINTQIEADAILLALQAQTIKSWKRLQEVQETYKQDLESWEEFNAQQAVLDETATTQTTVIDDMVADGYLYDGNYGPEINRISPEGNLYGELRLIQRVEHCFWWTGEEWLEFPDEMVQTTSASLLPTTGNTWGTLARVQHAGTVTVLVTWEYFFWNETAWENLRWYWTIDGIANIPATGYRIGDAHVVREWHVPGIWTGEEWSRLSIESLDGGKGALADIVSLVNTTTELQGDHNELLENFFGYQETVAQQFVDTTDYVDDQIEDVDEAIDNLDEQITNFSLDGWITLSEANSLKNAMHQLISESADIIAVATELGVVTEKAAYQAALVELQLALFDWIDQPPYPIEITELDREEVLFTFEEVQDRKTKLHNAIARDSDGIILEYVDEQIEDVTDAIGYLEEDIAEFSSDGFITFVESKALKISYIQLEAESTDIIAIATALGILTAKNNYIIALATLEDELALWVDLPEADYPVVILPLEREAIDDALDNVAAMKSALEKAINEGDRDYVDQQLGELDDTLFSLSSNVDIWFSDGVITELESETLTVALDQLTAESNDVIAIANGLEPVGVDWAEKLAYIEALSDLIDLLDNYIDVEPTPPATTAYPVAVTALQRTAINDAFALVKSTQAALTKKIQAANVDYVDGEISELDGAISDLSSNVDIWFSDGVITELESETLTVALDQLTAESNDVIAIANGLEPVGVDWAEKLAYIEALSDLIDLLDNYIDVEPTPPATTAYPVAVTALQRTAINDAFALVKSTQAALTKKIQAANVDYVDGEISELDGAISDLSSNVDIWFSDGVITELESETLTVALDQLTAESNDVIAIANGLEPVGVDWAEKLAYIEALSDLIDLLDNYIDVEPTPPATTAYPVAVTALQRTAIKAAFALVKSTQAALTKKIQETNIDYIDGEISELDGVLSGLSANVDIWFSDGVITELESETLTVALDQLTAESNDVIAIASGLEPVGVDWAEKLAYIEALSDLIDLLDNYIDVEPVAPATTAYPIAITGEQRLAVPAAFALVQSTKSALTKKIQAANIDYIEGEVSELDEAISDLSGDLDTFFSDGSVTQIEANSLKISLTQVISESTDIIAVADALEDPEDPWVQKTNYETALDNLETELNPWITTPTPPATYPLTITTQQRATIKTRFDALQTTKSALINKITETRQQNAERNANDYTDEQIEDVNEALVVIRDDILEFSDDGFITYSESVTLQRSLSQLNKESLDLVAVATSLGITVEKTNYSTALTNLSNTLNSWIGLASYPVVISSAQRGDIILRLETVENTKSLLVNEIIRKRQEDVAKYVNNQISDANSSLTALYNEWTNRASDNAITQAEAAILRMVMAQYLYEVDALKAIADAVDLDALALTYKNAALALTSGIGNLINTTYTYPVSVSSAQKAAIEALFETARTTKKALIDALTTTGTYGVGSTGFDVSQFRLIYDGFIRGFTPELELVYVSQNELSLRPRYNDFNYLKVNDQNIEASKRTSVYTFTPVLGWNESGQNLYYSTLQADTEYWVYLANRHDAFNINVYDFRGRLFCSGTAPSNNYLGEAGVGLDAILIGRAETDNNTKFRHELDVSLISRQSDLSETFREFSDFDLSYTDEDTITLERIYGTYGQIYVPESLYYIGENREVYTTSPRIECNVDETIYMDTSTIAANTLYYIYFAGDTDIYNFNDLNTVTSLPWHPEDSDPTPSLYDADKDFRLWMFLSTKEPEEGRLAETYQGFWARHIGQVRTDGTGKFIYSGGVSAIRQATLNPTYFDGLAEISILDVSTTTFKIIRKRGTSGIVMVGSKGTLTYDADNPSVHAVTTSDTVYTYTEANPSSPLSSTGTILDLYIGREKYVYLANDNDCWGALKNRTFLCDIEPTDAYLSQNFPGNNARWICTVNLAAGTKGTELVTNGNFVNSNDWDGNDGWGWSEENLNAYHNTGNTYSLDQISMTVDASGYNHELTFTVSGMTSGQSITPQLGGVNGTPVTTSGTFTQYIIPTSTAVLKFIPTSSCTAAIDSVSCTKIINNGIFAGTYITDSITGSQSEIDDSVVAVDSTWSSSKLNTLINNLQVQLDANITFGIQKDNGLDVILDYINTTTIRLKAVTTDTTIAFPDLQARTITTTGITLTVSGSASTRYYVYLRHITDDGVELYMSEDEPDNLYTKLEILETDSILVGVVALTATNAMSGNWNVCSSHNENNGIPKTWETAITANGVQVAVPCLVVAPRHVATVVRTGVTSFRVYQRIVSQVVYSGSTSVALGQSATVESFRGYSYSNCSCTRGYVTVSITPSTASITSLGGSTPYTYSEAMTVWGVDANTWHSGDYGEITGRSGSIIITRSEIV